MTIHTDNKTFAEIETAANVVDVLIKIGQINVLAACPLTWAVWNGNI